MWEEICKVNFLFWKNLVLEESCVGGTPWKKFVWEESRVGRILCCGSNPVREESLGRNSVGGIPHGRNPAGTPLRIWFKTK